MSTYGVMNLGTGKIDTVPQTTWGETFNVMFGLNYSELVAAVHQVVTTKVFVDPGPLNVDKIDDGDTLLDALQDRCQPYIDLGDLAFECLGDDFSLAGFEFTSLDSWGRLVARLIQTIAIAIWDLCSTGSLKQQIDQAVVAADQSRRQNLPERIAINDTLFVALGVDPLDEGIEVFEKAHPEKALLKVDLKEDNDGDTVAYVTLRESDDPMTLEQLGVVATLFTEFHRVYVLSTPNNQLLGQWEFQKDDTGNWWVAEDLDESTNEYDFGDKDVKTWEDLIDHCELTDFANVNICIEPEPDTDEE